MSYEEVERTLKPMEIPDNHQSLERKCNGVQESRKTQALSDIHEKVVSQGKKIPEEDSSEKDSRGSIEPYRNLNVTTEHTAGKALLDQPDNLHSEEEKAAAVKIDSPNFANQMTRIFTEESQVTKSSPERYLPEYFPKSSINDKADCQNFYSVRRIIGVPSSHSFVQNAVGVKSNLTQTSHQEDLILTSVSEPELQSPNLYAPQKLSYNFGRVSSLPPNPETSPCGLVLLQTQAQQNKLVPSQYIQSYNRVIIAEQICGVTDSAPAQIGSRNPNIPVLTGQPPYSGSGQIGSRNPKIPVLKGQPQYSGSGQISASNSQHLNVYKRPPDKGYKCSQSVIHGLKMTLKKRSTGERHQPYTDQKLTKLLPILDEISTPFQPP
ncbi:uncharacterized protein LOC128558682 isoform X2 [Mercenaria mercenaria]|nr:uncharacterized protein LOC128558682 isoform X2 [Mercenaria mercenaria]